MTRLLRAGGAVAGAFAVAGFVLCVGVPVASASPASLTVSIQPTTLTQGNQGLVQATFDNGGARLTGAALFLTFGSKVAFTPGSGCHGLAPLFPKTIACPLGVMAPNTSATRYVTFTVPSSGPVTVKGVAGYLSIGPLGAGFAKGSASAPVGQPAFTPPAGQTVQTETSDCLGQGDSASTSYGGPWEDSSTAGTDVTATGLNGAPCAALVTGVATDGSNHPTLFVKAAQGQQFSLVLTFPDEYLPLIPELRPTPSGWKNTYPTNLHEWPNYPDTSLDVIVPICNGGGSQPDPVAGYSTDSCIVSITSTDQDNDGDTGQIVLNTVGTGGDPGYHGG